MMRSLVVAGLVGGAACSTLPDLSTTCGNGVIDIDEDCDNTSSKCVQCALTCFDGTCDLPGYQCGADQRCHAPSGVFEQQEITSFAFPVGRGQGGDLDGDGYGDVVGFSDITIEAHFGDSSGKLETTSSLLIPFASTSPAVRTLDTGSVDVLVPTPDGIAAFDAQGKLVMPFPFTSGPGPRGECASMGGTQIPLSFFTISKQYMGVISQSPLDHKVFVTVIDTTAGLCAHAAACGMTMDPNTDFVYADHYDTSNATAVASAVVSIVVGTVTAMSTSGKTCTLRVKNVPSGPDPYTMTLLNGGAAITTEADPMVLARATAGAVCPTLFTAKPGNTAVGFYPGSFDAVAGECTVDLTSTATLQLPAGLAFPSGRIPLQPAIPGRAPDALVVVSTLNGFAGSSDIYSLAGTTGPISLFHSARPLFPIEFGDIDGNGTIEGVASAARNSNGPVLDLDVLYRTPAPTQGFGAYRIPTQGPPLHLMLGDYDGNGLADIAYTERIGARERLMLAYGTPDRPLPAEQITVFNNVVAAARIDIPDSIEPTGKVLDDLVIVDRADAMSLPQLSVLHGNPQRSMLAYYDPRAPGVQQIDPTEFMTVIPGNFDPATPAPDVLAIEHHTATSKDTAPVELWLFKGAGGETLEDTPALPSPTDIAGLRCDQPLSTGNAMKLCAGTANYLPWAIQDAGGTRDVVIAIDTASSATIGRHVVTLDPRSHDGSGRVTITPSPAVAQLPALTHLRSFLRGDIDGDGRPDLILTFGPFTVGDPSAPTVHVCSVADDGTVTACEDLKAKIPELDGYDCSDASSGLVAAHGRLDSPPDSPATDLVLLCHDKKTGDGSLFRIHHNTSGFHATTVLSNIPGTFVFAMADVNGDRVIDLIAITIDTRSGLPVLHIHPQCEARDHACRVRNSNGATQ